ncbi:cardiolipin synthase ClsB [Methylibium sp. T29]|uniref:cardiolipin synthase ClsB n=1 Tax=Methylibium sp. T29 TaxID=1430884 RepID=UPI0003F3FED7|nr:cardiolipin synthase ClsB [Methylibium sp. T29]EWS55428.1 putative cardiolipin synthase YbhO [Methylibium sp. T29]
MTAPAGAPPPDDPVLSEALAWYAHARAVFSGGNEVQLLRGGDALFPAMIESIGHATHEVWLATYIYGDDVAAQAVSAALVAAARRGVRVRVVVDGFGSLHALAALRERLEPAGVALAVFRPTQRWWNWLQPGQLRRLHQKLCVVDGQVGFVGGINVLDDRHDLNHGWGDTPRLDYAVRVQGAVVGPVEQTARAMWTRAAFGRDWRDEVRQIARSSQPMARARRLCDACASRCGAARQEASRRCAAAGAGRFVVRDNLSQRRSIERSYIDALRRAQQRIDIVSAYFYPGFEFRRALLAAARRGVRVRLLLQGKADYRFAALAAQALYDELLAHGVAVFEYTPAFLHAKVALVDQRWATVGSSNIDPLSLLVNLEANVIVDDRGFAATLSRELDRDFAVSREITAPVPVAGWRRWLRRGFVAWVARLYLRAAGAGGRY